MKIQRATTIMAETKPNIFYAADLMASKASSMKIITTENPPTILRVVVADPDRMKARAKVTTAMVIKTTKNKFLTVDPSGLAM
jgi:hypothetical protein